MQRFVSCGKAARWTSPPYNACFSTIDFYMISQLSLLLKLQIFIIPVYFGMQNIPCAFAFYTSGWSGLTTVSSVHWCRTLTRENCLSGPHKISFFRTEKSANSWALFQAHCFSRRLKISPLTKSSKKFMKWFIFNDRASHSCQLFTRFNFLLHFRNSKVLCL